MRHLYDRRQFLAQSVVVGAGLGVGGWLSRVAWAAPVKSGAPTAEKLGWTLGCAQYTFRRFCLYETLDKLVELGIPCIEPGFFLRLDSRRPNLQVNESLSAADRKELRQRLADRGIRMASYYSDLGADEAAARKKMEFAKEMGVETMVAEPPPEAFDMLEKLCEEYQLNLAIHNHPKGPHSRYWHPENVLKVCQGRSKRIGACCDTGHWVRSGLEPVECLRKLQGRILGFHLKDVIESGKPEARDVPLGQGKANYAEVLRELHRQGYKGLLVIEYEHDTEALMKDMAECVAFVEKMAKELAG
ncbi:MAG: sugar phosphate isomerase/epimerase [Thermoguttaceae bacterium]|nr:sugar phosphate isomerase/epimerase [Thermoguttaceae bacterium]MDW8038613.1 sugar phosphate isomerase/epimerase family protein [Thermoguttaceae bacterium]